MTRILLVDDDPAALDELKRKLETLPGPCTLIAARSGAEALERLSSEPCDLLLSDLGMPEMHGGELCAAVRERHPSIVRLMLFTPDQQELAQRSGSDAHRSLPKNAAGETLRRDVSQAIALQSVLSNPSLLNLIDKLDHLPTMPSLYFELVEAMRSPTATIESLGAVLSKDIGMTAKVLSIVNSALFGLREKVTSPGQAATFLGLGPLKSLVLSVGVVSQFDPDDLKHCSVQKIWEHSLRVATYSRAILASERAQKSLLDEAFLAGMMHDAGQLVLAQNKPERYHAASVLSVRDEHDRADFERRMFGGSHEAVGAYLLSRWGLPASVVEAVLFHHAPSRCTDRDLSPLCAVHVANVLSEVDLDDPQAELTGLDLGYLAELGLERRLARWIEACRAERDGSHA